MLPGKALSVILFIGFPLLIPVLDYFLVFYPKQHHYANCFKN